MAIDAMKAGKDVYVEKPMVQELDEGPRIIDAARQTGRILQVGSQHVSSIVYAKARELFRAGAIGELNLVEAWINRNSSMGAWQYSIPPDASPQTIDWDRFLGRAPKRPFEPVRLFRWRNYRDYGTGIPGDLFVHLFTGIHFVLDALGPTRAIASGGLRLWNDGRDVPDVMLALYDYPKTSTHPAFTLSLKVNFAEGAGDNTTFRFVGPEGVLTIGDNAVTLSRRPPAKEPGHTTDTFAKATQEAFMKEYRAKYPDRPELQPRSDETYAAPPRLQQHRRSFPQLLRRRAHAPAGGRRRRVRAPRGGPALLANHSYFENRPIGWDAEKMTRTSHRVALMKPAGPTFARASSRRRQLYRRADARPPAGDRLRRAEHAQRAKNRRTAGACCSTARRPPAGAASGRRRCPPAGRRSTARSPASARPATSSPSTSSAISS